MYLYSLLFSSILIFYTSQSFAGSNIAITEFVNSIRGSFNMLVADKHVVSVKQLSKTKNMIEKGYRNEVLNMQLLLASTGLDANIRMLNPRRYPDFSSQEEEGQKLLNNMIETLSKEAKRRIQGSDFDNLNSSENDDEIENSTLSDDIGTDIEFDDVFEEISLDTVADKTGNFISLDQVAQDTFLTLSQEYLRTPQFRGKEVLWYSGGNEQKIILGKGLNTLKHVFIPYNVNGIIKPMPLHSIFATTFMPDRKGVLYVMEMYIILVVNEAEHGTARVAQRKVDMFRWDRNPYYISAATGTILKRIFTSTLGQKVDNL